MRKSKRFYPAVVSPRDGMYKIRLPDFEECKSTGKTVEEAIENIKNLVNIYINNSGEDFEPPVSSNSDNIELQDNEYIVMVNLGAILRKVGKRKKNSIWFDILDIGLDLLELIFDID